MERVMQWVSCLLTGFGEGRTQNCTISVTTTTAKNPSIVLKTETINIFNHITTISTHLVDLYVSSAISQLFLGTPVHLQISHEPIT